MIDEEASQRSTSTEGMMSAMVCQVQGAGFMRLELNTFEVELKLTSIRMLFEYASELGAYFAPFISTSNALCPELSWLETPSPSSLARSLTRNFCLLLVSLPLLPAWVIVALWFLVAVFVAC